MSRKDYLLNEFFEVKKFFNSFLRHPLDEIKTVPDWHWYRLIGVHSVFASLTGALRGLFEKKSTFSIVAGIFVSPFLTLISLAVASIFFYYTFQIFLQRTVSPRRLFTVVMLANIPQLLFQIVSGPIPPISLVGMAMTALLLLVGFSENFQVDKKMTIRLIGFLYALFLGLWIWERVNSSQMERSWNTERNRAPEVKLGE